MLLHFVGSRCVDSETGQTFSPRANGRNSVGQKLPIFTVGCYMLRVFAHPVAGQTFSPVQTDTTLLGVVTSVCT